MKVAENKPTKKDSNQIIITEAKIQENLKTLRAQLTEMQTKVVMLQGAIQMTEHMLTPESELNDGKKE
jgi:uracil-DNA glycosylase